MRLRKQLASSCVAATVAASLFLAPACTAADGALKWSQAVADHFLGPYVLLAPIYPQGKLALIVGPNDGIFPTRLPAEAEAETATFDLTVALDGTVKSATRTSKPAYTKARYPGDDPVKYALERWRFRPFEENGEAISLIVSGVRVVIANAPALTGSKIQYVPNAEGKDMRARLENSRGCERGCGPTTATFEINGSGTFSYSGNGQVAVTGEHRSKIDQQRARALFDALTAMDPLQAATKSRRWMYHGYDIDVVTIMSGDRQIFSGVQTHIESIKRPNELDTMAQMIRDALDAQRWTKGTSETISSLQSNNTDFRKDPSLVESAAIIGNEKLVRELIARGAPISPTALAAGAGRLGNMALARHMIAHGASAADALPIAVKRLDFDAVRTLATLQTKPNRAALTQAMLTVAKFGKTELVRLLVKAGADPRGTTSDGNNRTLLMQAAGFGDPELVSFAFELGAEPNAKSKFPGGTALHSAAFPDREADRLKIIARLLAAGADVNARDNEGATPLMYAIRSEVLVTTLIAAGARVDAVDGFGRTALTRGCPKTQVARALIAAGARTRNPSELESLRQCWSKDELESGRDVIDLLSK